MSEKTLAFSESPLAKDLLAEVIFENDCSYMYVVKHIQDEEKAEIVAACWVKNHVYVEDYYSGDEDLKRGLQPKMPTLYCNYADDLAQFQEEDLELVWGEEGYAVALYEKDELVCVIPYWTDDHFLGYSKYSNKSDVQGFPWPLNDAKSNSMFERMAKAKTFWGQDFGKLWSDYQTGYISELEEQFGKHTQYYAIDGNEFPPRGLAVFEKDGYSYAFTIGMGLFPQPRAELFFENAEKVEKIELAFCYKTNLEFDAMKALSTIASIATIPWISKTFLADLHTVNFKIHPSYEVAVLVSKDDANLAHINCLNQQSVNLLWLLPLHQNISIKLRATNPTEDPTYALTVNNLVKSGKIKLSDFEKE